MVTHSEQIVTSGFTSHSLQTLCRRSLSETTSPAPHACGALGQFKHIVCPPQGVCSKSPADQILCWPYNQTTVHFFVQQSYSWSMNYVFADVYSDLTPGTRLICRASITIIVDSCVVAHRLLWMLKEKHLTMKVRFSYKIWDNMNHVLTYGILN